jgi:hypothetical protein
MRVAKIDLDAVAPILGHEAVVPKNNGLASALKSANHIPQVLGVQPARQGGGAHKIAEQHTDAPPLSLWPSAARRWKREATASAKTRRR